MEKGRKIERKRMAAFAAAFAALFAVLLTTPLTAQAAGTAVGAFEVTGGVKDTDYSYDETAKVLTIKTATALTIKNADSTAATQDRIQVEAGVSANITLAGVKIELGIGSETEYVDLAAFEILPDAEGNGSTGNVTITVADDTENTLKSGYNRAGIEKSGLASDTLGTLTIKGGTKRTGHLLARGGVDAPGIGSQNGTAKITIENVILTANTVGGGEKRLNGIGDSYGGEKSAKIVVRGGSVSAVPVNVSNALGGWFEEWPTDGEEYISLLAIHNPDGKKVWIDGEEYYPAKHAGDDEYLYAYLSQEGHSVRVGDEAEQVYYFSWSSSFERANQFSIRANDGKALVCGTDYTYDRNRLMVLTDRAVTISNSDSTEYTEHTLGVGKDVNADITLAGVKIRSKFGAALLIEDNSAGDVTLRVAENTENYLHGWNGHEGISKAHDPDKITPKQAGTLTITGAGSLVVEGGNSGNGNSHAGIGSDMDLANIVIDVSGALKIYGYEAPGIGNSKNDDDYTTQNVVIKGGTVSVIGGYYAPAIRTEELQLGGGSICLEYGTGFEGQAVENAAGAAVIPTNGEKKSVCLLAVENEDSLPVFIDGVSYLPVNHKALSNTGLYVYLPEGMHIVKVGDTEYKFICDAASGLASPIGSGMQITADDGSTLDYGVDYTYEYYRFPSQSFWKYNYYVLRILTTKAVTIRNADPETPLMEQIQVAKDVSANITLDGVSLMMAMNAPFEIEAGSTGNVCLTIADDSKNSLLFETYFLSSAGIQKNDGTAAQPGTLTIQGGAKGNGLLTVTGGAYSAGIGEGMVGTENLADIFSGAGMPENQGTSNIKILGGNIVTSGTAGIGSASGTAKNIQILGGTVTATAVALTTEEIEIKASAISGISEASDLVIDGGSVKAVPANGIAFGKGETAVTPVDGDGNAVYLLELENAAGATLKVDGVSYPVKHGEEAKLYLYLPAKTAQTPNRVTLGSVTTGYTYDEANGKWLKVADSIYPETEKAKLTGIIQPSAVNVKTGTALKDIILPGKVSITTEDRNIKLANVTWDRTNFAEGSYDPAVTTAQSFKLNGTLNLDEIHVDVDAVPNQVQITVNVTAAEVVSEPSADVKDGTYTENKIVSLRTATEGAEIYYTLDGSEPTAFSERYTGPIAVSGTEGIRETVVLKALAVKSGMSDSRVTTLQYVIDLTEGEHGIPAVKYGITVTSDGNGTAAASRTSAEAGTRITLEASAVTGYQFKAWQVIEGDITIRRNSFTMPAEEVSIRAVFEAIKEVVTDDPDDEDSDDDEDDDFYENDRTNTRRPVTPTGLRNVGNRKQYVKKDGTVARSEWVLQNGTWYYAGEDGMLVQGWIQTEDGTWYYLDEDCAMHTGWKRVNDNWYFLNQDGSMADGWVFDAAYNGWFYLAESGEMKTGWFFDPIYDSWFYFGSDGIMKTGWFFDPIYDSWFYFGSDGIMKTGWVQGVTGIWYYLKPDGRMAVNEATPDGYKVGPDGAWIP